ncbi:MAG: transcription termination/antitermination protein NusG [Ruminococcaceae bacterium]|nr:transcription termination/antitermination protein NusG [Oscillospiraceae bacterium]
MDENSKWYVVHTYSGYENKVATTIQKAVENRKLHDLIHDIRIPMETVTEVRDNGTREVERKLFPGYVLIKMHMTDESWYVVRNTRGVTSFVGPGSKPVPLTEEEVVALGVETKEIKLSFKVGSNVKVIDGPFEGLTGVVESIDMENEKVQIKASIFGRETPVELEFKQIAAMQV